MITRFKKIQPVFIAALLLGMFFAFGVPAQTNVGGENLAVLATAGGSYVIPVTITGYDNNSGASIGQQVINLHLNANSCANKAPTLDSFTVNNATNISAPVGGNLTFQWSSTCADSAWGYYTINKADACGSSLTAQNPWGSGGVTSTTGISAQTQSCQAGVTYTITENVKNSSTGQTDSKQVVVAVNSLPPTAYLLLDSITNNLTSNVGMGYTKAWGSTNANYWTSWYTVDSQDTCGQSGTGPFSWNGGNSASGITSDVIQPCQAGHVYTFTYRACTDSTCAIKRDVTATLTVPGLQTLACSPSFQTVNSMQIALLNATGPGAPYSWTTNFGNPSTGSGSTFQTYYVNPGTYSVMLSNALGSSTSCMVNVVSNLSCSPNVSSANPGTPVTFTAHGGGGTYTWASSNGFPSTGIGTQFTTTFNSVGTGSAQVTSGGSSAACTVPVVNSGMAITTGNATGTVGANFSLVLSGIGGADPSNAWTWSATNLPPGLTKSLSASTPVISGTPTTAGTYFVSLTATDAGKTATKSITITINPQTQPLVIMTGDTTGTVGLPFYMPVYTNPFTISGTQTWTISALPPGLARSTGGGNTVIITGTPTAVGAYPVTLSVIDGAFSATKTVTITISSSNPLAITTTDSTGIINQPFNLPLTKTGGTGAATTWSASGLPPGLSPAGSAISGVPTSLGAYSVTLVASDGTYTATKQITITIANPALTITTGNASGSVGQPFKLPLTAIGGTGGPYTWSAANVPPGLATTTVATSTFLAGTPTTAGNYVSVALSANDGATTTTKTIDVDIAGSPLVCSPASQPGIAGTPLSFSVSGGSGGTYNWSAAGGNPSTGAGMNFSTTYNSSGTKTISVANLTDTAQCTANITAPEPPSCSFGGNPGKITPPAASTLSWACSNTNSCAITPTVGPVNPVSGSVSVTPTSTTVYTLGCSGPGGSSSNVFRLEVATSGIIEIIP